MAYMRVHTEGTFDVKRKRREPLSFKGYEPNARSVKTTRDCGERSAVVGRHGDGTRPVLATRGHRESMVVRAAAS